MLKINCNPSHSGYEIICDGISVKDEKTAEKYNLNKPICYIIDGFETTRKRVYIFGNNNCEVIIRNSKFMMDLFVKVDGKCSIENTEIKSSSNLLLTAKELIIKNMNLNNWLKNISDFTINLGALNKLYIIGSSIGGVNERTKVSIDSDNIELVDSKIKGNDIGVKTNILLSDEISILEARDKVDIETKDFEQVRIKAPIVYVNKRKYTNGDNELLLEKITNPIMLKRLELIELLKKIKQECDVAKKKQLEEYDIKMNNNVFTKLLKKKNDCN